MASFPTAALCRLLKQIQAKYQSLFCPARAAGRQIRLDKRAGVDLYGVALLCDRKSAFLTTVSNGSFPAGEEDDE
jgi:hypothetical protein